MRPALEFWWREDLIGWTLLYWLFLPFVLAAVGAKAAWDWFRRRRRR